MVSVGDARHGRRDNGLVAAEYAAAGDVDPRVGEHLLDVLALEGIAAYLHPSSDVHPVTRTTTLPKRPTDRLFVDRVHLATARGYIAELAEDDETTGGSISASADIAATDAARGADQGGTSGGRREPSSDEIDRAFAQIVAGFGTTAAPRPGMTDPSPMAQDEPPQAPPGSVNRLLRYRPEPEQPSLLDGLDSFGAGLPDDTPEEFVPPEAPPVPRPSLPTALAVIGVIGGLAVFLKPDLLGFLDDSLAMFLGFTAIVSGFGTLVWRLRPGDEDDIDPDDGARV